MTSSCAPNAPSLDICPTQDQILTQLIALLPRGRAWGTHEGGPFPGGILYQFLNALAATRLYLEERICELRLEFFCATANYTQSIWLEQYGLPDACEPYPDLCVKVAAQGGITCADVVQVAQDNGWAVTCLSQICAPRSRRAGRARAQAGIIPATFMLVVDLQNSPAYDGGAYAPPLSGRLRAGRRLTCPPDLDGLKCLIARVAPAHVNVVYLIGPLS